MTFNFLGTLNSSKDIMTPRSLSLSSLVSPGISQGAKEGKPSIMSTGDAQADEEIRAFFKLRDDIMNKK